jgi:PRD domain
MDDRLALRVKLFREGGSVEPRVVDFVVAELDGLAATGLPVTESTAGMLTSHLVMALDRLVRGEAITGTAADSYVAAELATEPEAVADAQAIAGRAERTLGARLPEAEISFLALHLAVLARQPAP